jgi:hypothetical protein
MAPFSLDAAGPTTGQRGNAAIVVSETCIKGGRWTARRTAT